MYYRKTDRKRYWKEKNMTRKGRMSSDRVHFIVQNTHYLDDIFREAFCEAFGQDCPFVSCNMEPAKIVCRPSQFARFLIYRNDLGGKNGFKCLEPVLVPAEQSSVVDVSHNPAR